MRNLILFSFFIPFVSPAQSTLLWKVSKPGNTHVSYLFGTMHTNDSLLNTFDRTWWNAFESCDMMAGEIDMGNTADIMASLSTSMMKDTTLEDLYTPEELSRIRDVLKEKLDPMALMVVSRMKPFYIMASLMEQPAEGSPFETVMDVRLQSEARKRDMKVIGLESVTEQSASIEVISLQEQAVMLLDYIDKLDEAQKDLVRMHGFYHRQQVDSLITLEEDFEVPGKMMTSLLDDRNTRFIERLMPYLGEHNVFCAVGALHLTGPSGMVTQLKQKGYKVEPVNFTFTRP